MIHSNANGRKSVSPSLFPEKDFSKGSQQRPVYFYTTDTTPNLSQIMTHQYFRILQQRPWTWKQLYIQKGPCNQETWGRETVSQGRHISQMEFRFRTSSSKSFEGALLDRSDVSSHCSSQKMMSVKTNRFHPSQRDVEHNLWTCGKQLESRLSNHAVMCVNKVRSEACWRVENLWFAKHELCLERIRCSRFWMFESTSQFPLKMSWTHCWIPNSSLWGASLSKVKDCKGPLWCFWMQLWFL